MVACIFDLSMRTLNRSVRSLKELVTFELQNVES